MSDPLLQHSDPVGVVAPHIRPARSNPATGSALGAVAQPQPPRRGSAVVQSSSSDRVQLLRVTSGLCCPDRATFVATGELRARRCGRRRCIGPQSRGRPENFGVGLLRLLARCPSLRRDRFGQSMDASDGLRSHEHAQPRMGTWVRDSLLALATSVRRSNLGAMRIILRTLLRARCGITPVGVVPRDSRCRLGTCLLRPQSRPGAA